MKPECMAALDDDAPPFLAPTCLQALHALRHSHAALFALPGRGSRSAGRQLLAWQPPVCLPSSGQVVGAGRGAGSGQAAGAGLRCVCQGRCIIYIYSYVSFDSSHDDMTHHLTHQRCSPSHCCTVPPLLYCAVPPSLYGAMLCCAAPCIL